MLGDKYKKSKFIFYSQNILSMSRQIDKKSGNLRQLAPVANLTLVWHEINGNCELKLLFIAYKCHVFSCSHGLSAHNLCRKQWVQLFQQQKILTWFVFTLMVAHWIWSHLRGTYKWIVVGQVVCATFEVLLSNCCYWFDTSPWFPIWVPVFIAVFFYKRCHFIYSESRVCYKNWCTICIYRM